MKWAALLEFDVPVDLLEAMRVQKTACETIIGDSPQRRGRQRRVTLDVKVQRTT
jgi:hypothetical protein